jgi:hypothetical protein
MFSNCNTYTREDVLRYKTSLNSLEGVEIFNHHLFAQLKASQKAVPADNGLYKKTKRGRRAGNHTKQWLANIYTKSYKRAGVELSKRENRAGVRVQLRSLQKSNNASRGINHSNLIPIKRKPRDSPETRLPTIFLSNCRSLNNRKLSELSNTVDLYKPDILCLTETWLTDAKEASSGLLGYTPHFSHRTARIGGGVAIFTAESISAKLLEKYSSDTLSTLWVYINIPDYTPIILGCIYHPPRANERITMDHIEATLSKLILKKPTAKIILTGDFNRRGKLPKI